jgi:ferritin-like protein
MIEKYRMGCSQFKKISLLIGLMVLCLSSPSYAFWGKETVAIPKRIIPEWYGTLQDSSQMIGYGEGNSREAAILMARKEISESIQVQVSAETNINVTKSNKNITQDYTSTATAKTDVLLLETSVLREENQNNYWYIAISYDRGNLHKRLINMVSSSLCSPIKNEDYIVFTYLFTQIVQATGCRPNLKLEKANDGWMIDYNGQTRPLRDGDNFEDYFYSRVDNKGIVVNGSPSSVKNGKPFELQITSHEDGYISIYNVYGRGMVTELVSNIPISASKSVNFPKDVFPNNELVASLVNPKVSAVEMYVVVFNTTVDRDRRFTLAASTINPANNSFLFDLLLEKMSQSRFGTDVFRIEPY